MINGKFIATLTALIAIVFAICNFNTKNSITENFLPTMAVKPSRERKNSQGQFYSVPPNFQSNLSPRSNFGFSCPDIRYNPPASQHLAVPPTQRRAPVQHRGQAQRRAPVQHRGQAQRRAPIVEKFCGCGSPQCPATPSTQKTHIESYGNYADGNYNALVDQVDAGQGQQQVHETLPTSTMETVNSLGEQENVVNYTRLIYANPNSRNRGQGDPIRGDLAITPCNTGWFQVSANPALDLQQGAMNVMGGFDNGTAQASAALLNSETGTTTVGGVNLSTPELASIGSCTDITVNAFA